MPRYNIEWRDYSPQSLTAKQTMEKSESIVVSKDEKAVEFCGIIVYHCAFTISVQNVIFTLNFFVKNVKHKMLNTLQLLV